MPKQAFFNGNLRIARALQLAFLVLVILPVILVTSVAYVNSRLALQDEIRHRLRQDASVLVQGIDAFMFERLENLRGWQRLAVMQDVQLGDVDKRLAEFLRQLKRSYGGIYTELLFADTKGKVVASSEPADIDSQIVDLGTTVERVQLGGTWIELMSLQRDKELNTTVLPLRIAVQSDFDTARLGWLYAFLDWHEVEAILDRVTGGGESDAFRFAVLLDQNNQSIAQSTTAGTAELGEVNTVGNMVKSRLDFPDAQAARRDALNVGMGTLQISSTPTTGDGLLVGYAVSSGFQHFKGFGWRVDVVESMTAAFAPVRHLLWRLLLVLLGTVLVSVFLAARLGAWIAAPMARLAEYSNHCGDKQSPEAPSLEGVKEVQELNEAITDMVARLQHSRQQLVHASKLAAVGELAATLAHEVRTPLGILRSSSQLLSREAELSPQGQEMVSFILSESERLNRLVTLLLESGHPRSPVFAEMDINRSLTDCIALLRSKVDARHIDIHEYRGGGCSGFQGDAGQLQQVFLNLLLNAIQMTPVKGTISVSSRCQEGKWIIDIEDSGPGVDVQDREKIFEPFFTKRDGGFGLGLSIVQQIVVQHGGIVTAAESSRLGGADFKVVLPVEITKKVAMRYRVARKKRRSKNK